jgi:hypothetical protein
MAAVSAESVALNHYIRFAVVDHHVPHTTVPANRPHRPVFAPKRSPRAKTDSRCGLNMASGVGGSSADSIPAPWPLGLRLARGKSGRAA